MNLAASGDGGAIAIVTYPFQDLSGRVTLSRLVEVLEKVSKNVIIVTGPGPKYGELAKIIRLPTLGREGIINRVAKQVALQFRVSAILLHLRCEYDTVIFFVGSGLALPAVISRILRKRSIVVVTGLGSRRQIESVRLHPEAGGWIRVVRLLLSEPLEQITYIVAGVIVAYTNSIVREAGLEGHLNKVRIAREHFVNQYEFSIRKDLASRQNMIGYVGRLSEEKGVLNFVHAIPRLARKYDDMRFLVGGDGNLRGAIETFIRKAGLESKIVLPGWIPHESLATYLNELRLLVLPSYVEGLPNIVIEAMACGTPVLASPVGAVPDLVSHDITGFLLRGNSPGDLETAVESALSSPHSAVVSKNAVDLVNRDFTLESCITSWKAALGVNR